MPISKPHLLKFFGTQTLIHFHLRTNGSEIMRAQGIHLKETRLSQQLLKIPSLQSFNTITDYKQPAQVDY